MNTQIYITKDNEENLTKLKTLLNINEIKLTNKEDLINKAIELAFNLTQKLDEESLEAITGLKKKWS